MTANNWLLTGKPGTAEHCIAPAFYGDSRAGPDGATELLIRAVTPNGALG